MLRTPDADGPGYERVPSTQDIYDESEQLIQRTVTGAEVLDPIEFGRSFGYFDD